MEDSEIVRLVKEGNVDAFSGLVEKYHRHLLNFIYRLVGDEGIVEDIGQKVFLNVYKSLPEFDEKRKVPFSAWLFISARNRCISEIRSRRNKEYVPLDEIAELASACKSPQEVLLDAEYRDAVRLSLEQLPEPHKSALIRSVLGDSLNKIAVDEGVPAGTVKSRIFRAREKMKILMSDFFGGKT